MDSMLLRAVDFVPPFHECAGLRGTGRSSFSEQRPVRHRDIGYYYLAHVRGSLNEELSKANDKQCKATSRTAQRRKFSTVLE
jgi:hypothetical protein